MSALVGSAVAVALVAAGTVASYAVSCLLLVGRPLSHRLAGMIVVGPTLALAGWFALDAVGAFEPIVGAACAALLALALVRLSGRGTIGDQLDLDLARVRAVVASGARGAIERWMLFAVATPLGLAVAARALVVPPLGWDYLTYHGLRAAALLDGSLTFIDAPGPLGVYRLYPANVEVLFAWAMLPFHSDVLVGACTVATWCAVGVAVAALGRYVGLRPWHAIMVGAAAMFLPVVVLEVSAGYVDHAVIAWVVVGALFAAAFARDGRAADAGFALLAAGLAAGAKTSALAPALALALAVAASAAVRHRTGRAATGVGIGALLGALAVAPWMAVAYRETGHPLSPHAVSWLGVTLGEAPPAMRWYLERDLSGAYALGTELERLGDVLGNPLSRSATLGALTLVPLVLFVPAVVSWARRAPLQALAPALAALAVLAFYFLPGASVLRMYWAEESSRLLAPAAALALPVAFLAAEDDRRRVLLAAYLVGMTCFHAVVHAFYGWAAFEIVPVLSVIGVGLSFVALVVVMARHVGFPRALAALGVLGVLGLAALAPTAASLRLHAFSESFALAPPSREWRDGPAALETSSRPKRIAFTAGGFQPMDHWYVYPFLGASLENEAHYVAITEDGSFAPFGPGDLTRWTRGDRAAWLSRLSHQRIDHVVSFLPEGVEMTWMRGDEARFEQLAGNARWGVFRVRADDGE